MRSRQIQLLVFGLVLVVLVVGGIGVLTPLFGPARLGPMRGFRMGPMSFGMMREVHAMADVDSELDYMVRMIPHHQEAVDSAQVLLDRTNRPEMRDFAQEIISTQRREIEQMRSWLTAWYPEQDHDAEYQPMMRNYSRLSGDNLDLAFLQDMIPHHMAAVMMSEQLLSRVNVEHPQLEVLAAGIRTSQTQEIRQMSRWMDQWFN